MLLRAVLHVAMFGVSPRCWRCVGCLRARRGAWCAHQYQHSPRRSDDHLSTNPDPLPARVANTGVRTIVTTDQARALARHLLDPARALPVAVVSIDPHSTWSIDASVVSDAVTPLAEVVQITNGPLTRAFALAMPDQCQVYLSAARVYPAGTGWATNPRTTQLRIARTPAAPRRSPARWPTTR